MKALLLSRRFKSFYWRSGSMIAVGFINLFIQNLGGLGLSNELVVLLGLVLGEVTKALNTWWTGKTVSNWPFIVYRYYENENQEIVVSDFIEGFENIKTQLPEIVASSKEAWV